MLTLTNEMAERGLAIDLVLARAEGPFLAQVHEDVRVVDLGSGHVAKSLPRLTRYLRRERPHALLSSLNYVNIIAVIACVLARVPTRVILGEHSTPSQDRPAGLRNRVVRHLMPLLYPRADLVVAVSEGVADDLSRTINLARERIRVIYNPVVRPEILVKAAASPDHPWFREGEPPVVLGIGRLTEAKDFRTLIRAVACLRKHRNVRLIILGEGVLREALEAQVAELGVSDHVALPGFVDNPYSYIRRSAVFALSSRWEGLPTVLIEAMACGTSVVSTDCPSGPREILGNGVWGKLVPVGDATAIAEAIDETLDERSSPEVAVRAADFSVEKAATSYIDALT